MVSTTSSYWVIRSRLSISADGEPAPRVTDLDFILPITRKTMCNTARHTVVLGIRDLARNPPIHLDDYNKAKREPSKSRSLEAW